MAKSEQPCPCGSGLARGSCCGLDLGAITQRDAGQHLAAAIRQAIAASQRGDRPVARAGCIQILNVAPAQRQALGILAELCLIERRLPAAEALLRRIVALDPTDLWTITELAKLLTEKGDFVQAEELTRRCLRLAPKDPRAHRLMGRFLTVTERHVHAEYHHRRALVLGAARDAELVGILAWNRLQQGALAEARTLYNEALAAAPSVVTLLRGAALTAELERDFPRALDLLARAARVAPEDPEIKVQQALVLDRMRETEQALALLETALLTPNAWVTKGRLLDKLGRYEAAFAAFAEGRRQDGARYDDKGAARFAARLKQFFTRDRLELFQAAAPRRDVAQPIFILGFPRSGTTLVEQVLSAHPQIAAGDELPAIGDLTRAMPGLLYSPLGYPEALLDLVMADQHRSADRLRDYYFDYLRDFGVLDQGTRFFTDKKPLNEMHLGLIGLVLPQAPLIHVVRHPLDVVLSVFSNLMTYGYFCGASLESAARHYVLIADLVEHYRAQMKLNYCRVRYEDLVEDHEASVRGLLDFVGVEFDPRCLEFHENRRYARTASARQVTEKLYTSSCYRHRNYRRELAAIEPILRPVIERLGYA